MSEVYLSRYLHRGVADVVAVLARQPGLGPAFHLPDGLSLLPVARQEGGRLVLTGERRVLTVASGNEPVCELLLVAEVLSRGRVDPEAMLEALVAELEAACPEVGPTAA